MCAQLFTLELRYEAVVTDEYLHLVVLGGEGAVLILHFHFLQFKELYHLFIGLVGLAETNAQEGQRSNQYHGYNDDYA